jgi:uncharacterized cupin superfamily protein
MQTIPHPAVKLEDTEWKPVDPNKLIEGFPQTTYKILHAHPGKEFYTGIYECTPGKWKVIYEEEEFCTLVEGHAVLTSEEGLVQEYKAPDSFVIPAGFKGTWEAVTHVRKLFAIYEKLKG